MTEESFFAQLVQVMYSSRRNKRYGRDSIAFEYDWAARLVNMFHQLMAREFRIAENYTFLTSVPKWREIFATYYEGRMADHLLCDPLKPYIERELHSRTFNNREGMGAQAAINQVMEDIYEVSKGYTEPAWIIKWDLQGFFPNADCSVMEKMFLNVINKYHKELGSDLSDLLPWLSMVCIHCRPTLHCERRTPLYFWDKYIKPEKSLFSKPDGIGVPIGRMSSQTGMGLYINDEVRWLNDEMGIRTTVFMDDGVMVVPEMLKDYALSLIPELRRRFSAKGVRMNNKKFYCQPYQHGLEFLGSHIKPGRIILNDQTYSRCLKRLEYFNNLPTLSKYEELDAFISTVNSYTGILKNRTSRRRIQYIKDSMGEDWWKWLEWDQRRLCVISKPQTTKRARLKDKYNLKFRRHETGRNQRSSQ